MSIKNPKKNDLLKTSKSFIAGEKKIPRDEDRRPSPTGEKYVYCKTVFVFIKRIQLNWYHFLTQQR